MRIASIGGGPAGLYAAILLKKSDPSREVVVYERNGAEVTFGWGVVFSEQTLGNLRTADPESYGEIERAFVRWGDIAIEDRGARFVTTGHDFCGLSRKRLLAVLQSRARGLGVELQFERESPSVTELSRTFDLVLAADGINSVVRQERAAVFKPSIDLRKCRYIWLGATRRLPEFTFWFRENGHGVFQVHAYPFDDTTSTFIVETDEETYVRAGLDKADEAQSIAYCQALFAKELKGSELLGNRSSWLQFRTIKNERWSDGNVVLLGDAVHTAHFSIGSGTKLAMEDSIALAAAIDASPRDVPAALAAYELARRPEVERLQRAAQESLEWFENVPRYYRAFEPIQLAFSLLTRSRRISHESLRARDPELVAQVDRWYATRAGVAPAERTPPPMFTPFELRSLRLANRIVVSPMCMYSATDGVPNDFHLVHYGSRAMGGAALLITEMTCVAADARITPGCTGLWNDEQESSWKRIVDFARARSKIALGIQLGHAGRKGATKLMWDGMDAPLESGAWALIAPSPVPYLAGSQVPREMTRADMDRVIAEYVASTQRAARLGFDFLELHMAHGYLLAEFLTPLVNRREDEYGGTLENRLRFPLELWTAVRRAWPADRPMGVRLSAHDWADGGITSADVVTMAGVFAEHGCDIFDVSSGQTSPDSKPRYGRMWQAFLSDLVRNEARVPTMTVGGITTPDEACSILAAGRADLCVVARAHLDDPHWTLHAAKELGWDVTWPVQYDTARVMPLRRR